MDMGRDMRSDMGGNMNEGLTIGMNRSAGSFGGSSFRGDSMQGGAGSMVSRMRRLSDEGGMPYRGMGANRGGPGFTIGGNPSNIQSDGMDLRNQSGGGNSYNQQETQSFNENMQGQGSSHNSWSGGLNLNKTRPQWAGGFSGRRY